MDNRQGEPRIDALFLYRLPVHVEGRNVPVILDGVERDVRHADLFALVDIRRPLLHVHEGRQHLGGLDPVAAVVGEA